MRPDGPTPLDEFLFDLNGFLVLEHAVDEPLLVKHGVFRCGLVNVIVALTAIGEGYGATMVVPGSHKSSFPRPEAGSYEAGDRMDALPAAVPVHLRRGDALLFVDALMHGGSTRTSAGERRVLIYRYGPVWGASRFGYVYDQDWIDGLPEARRAILQPVPPVRSGDPLPGP